MINTVIMQFIIYRITNTLNGKYYVGAHVTDNLDDGYMGSGTALLNALKRHGRKNFNKEILESFDSAEQMFAREAEIVNDEFVADRKTYNIINGGMGGPGHTKSDEWKKSIQQAVKDKYDAGELSRNGGRGALTPNIIELVEAHDIRNEGVRLAAERLGVSFQSARDRYYRMKRKQARVVKLADTQVLGTCSERSGGSSPSSGTNLT